MEAAASPQKVPDARSKRDQRVEGNAFMSLTSYSFIFIVFIREYLTTLSLLI